MATLSDGYQAAKALLVASTATAPSIQAVLDIANKWRPSPQNYSFSEEMEARENYLLGSMQGDMLDVLRRRFPRRYDRIMKEQVNLQLYRAIINAKAKTFADVGEMYLADEAGNKVDGPGAEAFADMVERGQFWAALKDADRYTQALSRAVVELTWDDRRACVVPNVWSQRLVHVAPNPMRYWSLDDAYVVAFEMPSEDGLLSTERRYKTWVKVKTDTGWESAHYLVGSQAIKDADGNATRSWYSDTYDGNADAKTPFLDERTGEPVFPFVLWKPDLVCSLYWLGNEDALTINRMLNSALTDLNWNAHFHAHPIGSWEPTSGETTGKPPANVTFSPEDFVEGGDWKPVFTSPEFDPEPVRAMWDYLLRMDSALDGNSPIAMLTEGGPESGYALKIRNLPLTEHRQNMIEVYRPHVIETMRRAIMVWNTYAPEYGLATIEGEPCWEPGQIEPPRDEEADARVWQLKIQKNVSTAVDWRMSETGEDREMAEAAIRENAELNKELAELGIAATLMGAGSPFGAPAQPGKPPAPPSVDDEQDEDEDDKSA